MEEIYLKRKIPATAISKHVDLSQYFDGYSKLLRSVKREEKSTDFFKRSVGLSLDEVQTMLKKTCLSRIKLKSQKGSDSKVFLPVAGFRTDFTAYELPENYKCLKTLTALNNRPEKDKAALRNRIKYSAEIDIEDIGGSTREDKLIKDIVPFKDYLVTIRVYLPSIHTKFTHFLKNRVLQVSQEFLVPSTCSLECLRDRIGCATDFQPLEGDVSQDPLTPATVCAKDAYKSAMFYIGNTFYIDCRYPENIDYSAPIRLWAQRKKINMDSLEPMEATKISDLKQFRLGYPYLYMHQGDCEHLIIFTDARLILPRDILSTPNYPIIKSFGNLRGCHCMTCGLRIAKFIVTDTDRLPSDHSYLCTICMQLYNYVDGVKVDNFKAYKYVDRVALF